MIDQLKATLPTTPVLLLTGVLFDPQVFQDRIGFIPNLSILDLLFNTGPQAADILNHIP